MAHIRQSRPESGLQGLFVQISLDRGSSIIPTILEVTQGQMSISHRCYLFEVAFVWELTKETIVLPLGCLQGGCPVDLPHGLPKRPPPPRCQAKRG